MPGSNKELSDRFLDGLSREQWVLSKGIFTFATAFILLHELGHLHLGHSGCTGLASIFQEKEVDRFAAEWLSDDPTISEARRLNCLFGIAIALIWLTVFDVFLGPGASKTHPRSYDRLFQVLDQVIRPDDEVESLIVWDFVSRLLFVHMDTAGFEFVAEKFQLSPRDQVNYMIDLLSRGV
jgi:hypothetical protein